MKARDAGKPTPGFGPTDPNSQYDSERLGIKSEEQPLSTWRDLHRGQLHARQARELLGVEAPHVPGADNCQLQ